MKVRVVIAVLLLCGITAGVTAQEKPIVSPAELVAALEDATMITEQAVALRGQMPDSISTEDFVRGINDLQGRCEPILSLIIGTNPPREAQQFAMTIAMGIKGVDLALWYYIFGTMANEAEHLQYADELLGRGFQALAAAYGMSGQFR